jgi:fructose-1,6-bisphosphatase class II
MNTNILRPDEDRRSAEDHNAVSKIISKSPHLDFLRVTERAALLSARWVGKGLKHEADDAACKGMRSALNELDINGLIVIGEGEMDEAPMLYIGERVGSGNGPEVEIAVDPLEGTNLCANGMPNAIAVLAGCVKGEGHLLHAPDCYMEKLVVGSECKGALDITLPPRINVTIMSKCLGKKIDELTIGILDRPRHHDMIKEIREIGARVHLISDGDLSIALAALDIESGVDALMGSGGAPEGVISAAAALCYGGEMQARFVWSNEAERERAQGMFAGDVDRVLHTTDLASGHVQFCATGITSGDMLKGVRYTRECAITESILMRSKTGTIRKIQTMHRNFKRAEDLD